MAHIITVDRIGQGWDLLIADQFPCETFCIQVKCVLCGGTCYTAESYAGRARLFTHYDCADIDMQTLLYRLRSRGITPDVFSLRN